MTDNEKSIKKQERVHAAGTITDFTKKTGRVAGLHHLFAMAKIN